MILVFFASIGFSFVNTEQVPLSLGFWEFAPQPVALWVISAFTLGGLLGVIFATSVSGFFKRKMEIRQLRKQLTSAEAELKKIKEPDRNDNS